MADSDDHIVVRNEILLIEVATEVVDLGLALVAKLLLDLGHLISNHLHTENVVGKDRLEISNEVHHIIILLVQILNAETCELAQSHIDDSLRLDLVDVETSLQVALCIGWGAACTDDANHLVDIVAGNDESLKDVSAFLCLIEVKLGAANHHLMTVSHEVCDEVLKVEQLWHAKCLWMSWDWHESDIVYAEIRLQLGHLEELVEQYIGIDSLLHIDHDAHTLTV